jgi:hypothetical protein
MLVKGGPWDCVALTFLCHGHPLLGRRWINLQLKQNLGPIAILAAKTWLMYSNSRR